MGGSNGLKEGKEEPNKATSIQHHHSNVHLKKPIWGRCTEVRRSSPWNDLVEQPLKRVVFVEAIVKRIRPLP